jgi:hypothetical protein
MRTSPPHPFPDGAGVSAIAIAAGLDHTCVIVIGGGVKCWGSNRYGQLGIGNTVDQFSPADVPGVPIIDACLNAYIILMGLLSTQLHTFCKRTPPRPGFAERSAPPARPPS